MNIQSLTQSELVEQLHERLGDLRAAQYDLDVKRRRAKAAEAAAGICALRVEEVREELDRRIGRPAPAPTPETRRYGYRDVEHT